MSLLKLGTFSYRWFNVKGRIFEDPKEVILAGRADDLGTYRVQIMGLTCEIFVYQKKAPKKQLSFFDLGANSKALFGNPCNGHGSSFMPDDLFCSL